MSNLFLIFTRRVVPFLFLSMVFLLVEAANTADENSNCQGGYGGMGGYCTSSSVSTTGQDGVCDSNNEYQCLSGVPIQVNHSTKQWRCKGYLGSVPCKLGHTCADRSDGAISCVNDPPQVTERDERVQVTAVDGKCGTSTRRPCEVGQLDDLQGFNSRAPHGRITWVCKGTNGGKDVACSRNTFGWLTGT